MLLFMSFLHGCGCCIGLVLLFSLSTYQTNLEVCVNHSQNGDPRVYITTCITVLFCWFWSRKVNMCICTFLRDIKIAIFKYLTPTSWKEFLFDDQVLGRCKEKIVQICSNLQKNLCVIYGWCNFRCWRLELLSLLVYTMWNFCGILMLVQRQCLWLEQST